MPSFQTCLRISATLLFSFTVIAAMAFSDGAKSLQIYFVDVEGGQATLFVTPTGQSLLIDTGWPDNNGRDADRIVAAAKDAGVRKIDYVLITHYHTDHVGGAPQLAARIPIGTFIDHGENRQTDDPVTVQGWQAYQQLLATGKYKHIVPKPSDTLPLEGVRATVVTADAATITNPLPGGGQQNDACKDLPKYPQDQTENRRSLGIVIDLGKLRIVDLGDLTHDQEVELMCPMNKLGHADIFIVSHHGWEQSDSPALVWGLAPRVAIMDNGAKKGGSPSVWDIIEKSPGLENLWQLHFSDEGGAAHNVPAEFIANLDGPEAGNYLKVLAWPDGSFNVFNSRTHLTNEYVSKNLPGSEYLAATVAHDYHSSGSGEPTIPALAPGVMILTPTEGVNFSSYLETLLANVKKNWYAVIPQEAHKGKKGIVIVRLKIHADGQTEPPKIERSAEEALDAAAVKGITESAPFEPLPKDFRGPFIELRFAFFYNVPANVGQN